MPKVHYSSEPEDEESYVERARCGTLVGEPYLFSNDWKQVTCKRCLTNRVQIEAHVTAELKDNVDQLGDMAEFFAREQQSQTF